MKTKITTGSNAKIIFSRDSRKDIDFEFVVLQSLPNVEHIEDYDSITFDWETFSTQKSMR